MFPVYFLSLLSQLSSLAHNCDFWRYRNFMPHISECNKECCICLCNSSLCESKQQQLSYKPNYFLPLRQMFQKGILQSVLVLLQSGMMVVQWIGKQFKAIKQSGKYNLIFTGMNRILPFFEHLQTKNSRKFVLSYLQELDWLNACFLKYPKSVEPITHISSCLQLFDNEDSMF